MEDGVSETEGLCGDIPPALIDTVTSLALAIDSKDHYTQGHSQKVAAYAALIADALGLKEEEIGDIRLGALLHDIGKVGIPEEILGKRGPLSADEWEKMKEHVVYGDRMLEPLQAIAPIRKMVCHHHEMFDGSGYPQGLVGEQIPIGSRIIAIADAYDTITSERIYKKARTPAAAFEELERCAGSQLIRNWYACSSRLFSTCRNGPWKVTTFPPNKALLNQSASPLSDTPLLVTWLTIA